MHETPLGPSTSGSVVLELGPGIGALVLHTPPELDGAEIEISPVAQPRQAARTNPLPGQATASPRAAPCTRPSTRGLAAGEYTIWRDETTPAMTVTVDGGQVTTAQWPGV